LSDGAMPTTGGLGAMVAAGARGRGCGRDGCVEPASDRGARGGLLLVAFGRCCCCCCGGGGGGWGTTA
jgi:hypothetical protein